LSKQAQEEIATRGFPAHGFGGVFSQVLYRGHSEKVHPNTEKWNPGEFERVAEKLKEKYAELYKSTNFKRRVPKS
jgi:hypothetical protein